MVVFSRSDAVDVVLNPPLASGKRPYWSVLRMETRLDGGIKVSCYHTELWTAYFNGALSFRFWIEPFT